MSRTCLLLAALWICPAFSPFALANDADTAQKDARLAVRIVPAFEKITWAGWEPVNDEGVAEPFRPVIIDNAGDDSNRLFVGEQRGTIYVFKNDQSTTESKVFLNFRDKVRYSDRENEEGFLGLAFHPKYKENGQFFVYYTENSKPRVSVISRFRVSADDPDKADPDSEEQLLRIEQPYWNHNGGTIAFGPDGYLYVGMGDGGAANDPHGNGQKLSTLLGKILRIDVDKKTGNLPYGIPADNPFVKQEGTRGEIYAYGLRNVWRLSFDRKTKLLWAADVGQDLWEEIDIIRAGGNYGWNLREGKHPFAKGPGQKDEVLIDPIFEYHHDIGKSITGGNVYRGTLVPKLVGKYLYADYVSGKIWALDYDEQADKVRANYQIESPMLPVITFGEDEAGEVYFSIVSPNGKGLYRFVAEEARTE